MPSDNPDSTTPLFAVDVRLVEGRSVVAVIGELDLATAPELRERLALLSQEGKTHVTLDLSRMDFVDSTGLSVFVMASHRAEAEGGSMVILNPSSPVMRIFEITGLTSLFTIAHDGAAVPTAGA
jgi:anti-sigma B factor antagonist